MVVIADPGDALFASSDLVIHRQTEYLAPAYYTSMGFAVPAALGVMVARPDLRPIVLVGDGAFQMTGMELSTHRPPRLPARSSSCWTTGATARSGCCSPGRARLQRHPALALPQAAGGPRRRHGLRGPHRGRVRPGPAAALADRSGLSLLHVHLDPSDASLALERLARPPGTESVRAGETGVPSRSGRGLGEGDYAELA